MQNCKQGCAIREALAPLFGITGEDDTGEVRALSEKLEAIPKPERLTPLNPWQFRFTYMVAMLIVFAYNRGYTLTFGNARVDRGCTVCGGGRSASSLHFEGLAVDINLFRNGKFLTSTLDHHELGMYWESIGGAWGGRFNDGNHYSLEYNGRK